MILKFVNDDELWKVFRDKGFINQQRFSWRKSAEKINLGLKK